VDPFQQGSDQTMVDKTMECYMGEIERNLDYKRWTCGGFEGVHGDEGMVRGVFC